MPEVAHVDEIHITAAAETTLDATTKVEETSTFTLDRATTIQERKNLNSADGHTRVTATWHTLSGSLEGQVKLGSAAQTTMTSAAEGGTAVYIHVLHTPGATTPGAEKGHYYKCFFSSFNKNWTAEDLVKFSANFQVDGAATQIVVPGP